MTATQQLQNLATNENGFAFDSVSGASYQISELGLEIIEWVKAGVAEEDMCQRIGENYDVDEHSAERDLTTFLANLRSLGLIEG